MAEARWWQRGVVYQIYPRSFQDSNGDGVGDLPGIVGRLDYLAAGSASTRSGCRRSTPRRWPTSATTSPTTATSTRSSARWRTSTALMAEAHARGIRVILDFVPNHTSDQHPWFVESRVLARQPEARLVHLARPGAGRRPAEQLAQPTSAAAPGSGTSRPASTTSTLPERAARPQLAQPRGRRRRCYDVAALLARPRRRRLPHRRDLAARQGRPARATTRPTRTTGRTARPRTTALLPIHSADRPEVHELIGEMRAVRRRVSATRVLVGEIYLPLERLMRLLRRRRRRRPPAVQLPAASRLPWDARGTAPTTSTRYEAALPPRRLAQLGARQPRHARGSPPASAPAQARVAAMLLLTLRGTPTLYYGDEIGHARRARSRPTGCRTRRADVPGSACGRDPERTPMQWDAGPNAGFTTGEPWLPLARRPRRSTSRRSATTRRSMLRCTGG